MAFDYTPFLMIFLWVVAIGLLVYGGNGLRSGKIRAWVTKDYYSRKPTNFSLYKDLKGKWAYVYSMCLVIMGAALLIGLIYNTSHCGVLALC
jgi:hypothetical protein